MSSLLSLKTHVNEQEYKNMECLGWGENKEIRDRGKERNGWGTIRNFSDDI